MTNEERAEKLRIDLHNTCWDEELVLILAFADEIRREAIVELATKIADWPMEYNGPSPDQGEAESYYEIMKYCYGLIGREWK